MDPPRGKRPLRICSQNFRKELEEPRRKKSIFGNNISLDVTQVIAQMTASSFVFYSTRKISTLRIRQMCVVGLWLFSLLTGEITKFFTVHSRYHKCRTNLKTRNSGGDNSSTTRSRSSSNVHNYKGRCYEATLPIFLAAEAADLSAKTSKSLEFQTHAKTSSLSGVPISFSQGEKRTSSSSSSISSAQKQLIEVEPLSSSPALSVSLHPFPATRSSFLAVSRKGILNKSALNTEAGRPCKALRCGRARLLTRGDVGAECYESVVCQKCRKFPAKFSALQYCGQFHIPDSHLLVFEGNIAPVGSETKEVMPEEEEGVAEEEEEGGGEEDENIHDDFNYDEDLSFVSLNQKHGFVKKIFSNKVEQSKNFFRTLGRKRGKSDDEDGNKSNSNDNADGEADFDNEDYGEEEEEEMEQESESPVGKAGKFMNKNHQQQWGVLEQGMPPNTLKDCRIGTEGKVWLQISLHMQPTKQAPAHVPKKKKRLKIRRKKRSLFQFLFSYVSTRQSRCRAPATFKGRLSFQDIWVTSLHVPVDAELKKQTLNQVNKDIQKSLHATYICKDKVCFTVSFNNCIQISCEKEISNDWRIKQQGRAQRASDISEATTEQSFPGADEILEFRKQMIAKAKVPPQDLQSPQTVPESPQTVPESPPPIPPKPYYWQQWHNYNNLALNGHYNAQPLPEAKQFKVMTNEKGGSCMLSSRWLGGGGWESLAFLALLHLFGPLVL